MWVALTLSSGPGPKVGANRHDVLGEGVDEDAAIKDAVRKVAAWYGVKEAAVWFFGAWPA